MNNKLEKEFQIEMVPEVTQRIVALSGKINQILAVKTSEITGLEDFITSLLASERADWLRSEIEKLGDGSTVEYVLKHTVEDQMTYDTLTPQQKECFHTNVKKVVEGTLTSIITRYKEELLELEKGV